MASGYRAQRSTIVWVTVPQQSRSVPETPAKKQHPPFRTVPDTPKHCRLLSDDNGLDFDVLTHKLQLYQLELEEAELRFTQRRMADKVAADVAAAARFRDELEKRDLPKLQGGESGKQRARSASTQSQSRPFPNRTSSLRAPNMIRSKRPNPLFLVATTDVAPQEVQSAMLPPRRKIVSQEGDDHKRHWRRTTISAGRDTTSNVITISSPGHHEEQNFDADVPPVPELSTASSITSPSTMSSASPMTPQPTEDQIRRELETFALEEGPDIRMSRRSSVASRKRLPAAFVPDAEDRMLPKTPPIPPQVKALPDVPFAADFDLRTPIKNDLTRKKSFFSRFERKDEVGALLDLYMTDQQIEDHKTEKKKAHRSRRQTFFKRFQPNEPILATPKNPNPG